VRTTLPVVTLWDGTAVAPSSATGYDGEGNAIRQVDANGAVTLSSYDPLGREISTTNPVSGTTVITYNATEKVAEQDPQGNVTRYAYDGAGRLRQEIDPTGSVTQDGYDSVGNTTAITTGDRNTVIQVDTRQYDALNRVMTDTVSGPTTPAQETLTWYDLDGNRAMVQNPNGDSTVYNYDLADQLIDVNIMDVTASTATNDQKYEEYSYDAAGNQVQSQDADGRTTMTTFDGGNRVTDSIDVSGTTTITTTQRYDPDGNAVQTTRLTQDGGGSIQQQVEAMTVNAAGWTATSTDGGLTTAYGYDAAGQERSRTILNGVAPITTTLDAEGRATAIGEGLDSKTPYTSLYGYNMNDLPMTATLANGVQEGMGYDGASRLITMTATGPAAGLGDTYAYGYDAASRTSVVTRTVGGMTSTLIFAHDAEGRLTSVGTDRVAYDANGNISSSISGGVTTAYTYGTVPNELQSVSMPGQPTTHYSYDGRGDTISITHTASVGTALSYDSQARLSSVVLADGTNVTMGYNANGQRARYTVSKGGVTSLDEGFSYRRGELGQVTVVSGTQTYTDTYVYDPNGLPLELLRQPQGQPVQRYWYVLDGRSNVVALTDITGTVVDRYAYDVWGAPTGATESVPQPFRYAGYWWDSALNWYWVSVRSYDPALKRWLQPDASEQDGVRTYVYVDNDPIDLIDPVGQSPQPGWWYNNPCYDAPPYPGAPRPTNCSKGQGAPDVGGAVYSFVIGDDINGIHSGNFFVAGLAVVDIASNVMIFVPFVGDAARVGVKGITEAGIKILMHGVEHDGEHVAEQQAASTIYREVHHFAINKHSLFTPQMKEIADEYGLNLDDAWNKELLAHRGRHVTEYHQLVLSAMQRAAREAGTDTGKFLDLFEKYVKAPVRANPDILYRRGWGR